MNQDYREPEVHHHPHEDSLSIRFYEYGKGIFLWPLVVFCPLFVLLSYFNMSPAVLGWAYLIILFLVILAVTVDVSRNTAIVFLMTIAMLLFLCLYVDEKTMPIFHPLAQGIHWLGVQFDAGQALAITIFAFIIVGYSIIKSRINGRWHMTTNELQHFQFGQKDDSLARGAKTFSAQYEDWLELALGFSGTIIVSDSNSQRIIRRIPHILLLPFRMRRIQKILAARSFVEQHEEDAINHGDQDSDAGGHA